MYGKIFESMYDGTIAVNWKAMVVFQQMIVLCDSDGVIDMTSPAISRRTNIPLDIIVESIKFLCQPDEQSRSASHEGKRLIPINEGRPWGWKIVNHAYYRSLASHEDKKEKDRIRIAEKRSQVVDSKEGGSKCRKVSQAVVNVAYTDTDTNTDKALTSDSDEPDNFDIFWRGYPKKQGKKKARSAFNRLSKKNQLAAIADSSTRFQATEVQYIPMPTSYLNGERWSDQDCGEGNSGGYQGNEI